MPTRNQSAAGGHDRIESNIPGQVATALARALDRTLDRAPLVEHRWPGSRMRYIADKAHLYSDGDPRSHVYKVMSGAVCLYRMLEDGRRQVIDFAFAGDLIGLGSGRLETCNAQALGETQLSGLPISTLMAAAKSDTRIALGLYEALSRELVATREHLMCLGHRGATERVATFLVILAHRNEMRGQASDVVTLPMSRTDIADFLGTTLETVSRTLTKLRVQGLIDIEQITTVRLVRKSKLVALAEGRERV
jgi:CRP-like cAMP-binding protein